MGERPWQLQCYDDLSLLWGLDGLAIDRVCRAGSFKFQLRYNEVRSREPFPLGGHPLCFTPSSSLPSSSPSSSSASLLPQVFPPTPVRPAHSFYEQLRERASLLPRPDKPCPAYVEPMTGEGALQQGPERERSIPQAVDSGLSFSTVVCHLRAGAVAPGC